MIRLLSSLFLFCFSLSFLILPVHSALPQQMLGYWRGSPIASPLGPWGHNTFNLSVAAVGDSDSEWLISDYFEEDNPFVPTSIQQFWVKEGLGLEYCGVVQNFFGPPGPIFVNFTESHRSDTSIEWCLNDCNQASFTLALWGSDSLNMHVYLDNPIHHLNVTLNRVLPTDSSTRYRVPSLPPPCDFSLTPVPPPSAAINKHVDDLPKSRSGFVCPHAESIRRKARELNEDVLGFDKKIIVPTKLVSNYQFCYILNPFVEFSLSWNFSKQDSRLDIALSIPNINTNSLWLGLGFQPEFPAMQGADIALGYPTSSGACVRSMYAASYVGTPIESTAMVLTNTQVVAEDDRVTVMFSRSFFTGHHNITVHDGILFDSVYEFTIMWASGLAPRDCKSPPIYHNFNRGVRMIDWEHPARIFPDFMKCTS